MPQRTQDVKGDGGPKARDRVLVPKHQSPLHLLLCGQGTHHACTGTGTRQGFHRLSSLFPPSFPSSHLLFEAGWGWVGGCKGELGVAAF